MTRRHRLFRPTAAWGCPTRCSLPRIAGGGVLLHVTVGGAQPKEVRGLPSGHSARLPAHHAFLSGLFARRRRHFHHPAARVGVKGGGEHAHAHSTHARAHAMSMAFGTPLACCTLEFKPPPARLYPPEHRTPPNGRHSSCIFTYQLAEQAARRTRVWREPCEVVSLRAADPHVTPLAAGHVHRRRHPPAL